jgi:hypothetical protein
VPEWKDRLAGSTVDVQSWPGDQRRRLRGSPHAVAPRPARPTRPRRRAPTGRSESEMTASRRASRVRSWTRRRRALGRKPFFVPSIRRTAVFAILIQWTDRPGSIDFCVMASRRRRRRGPRLRSARYPSNRVTASLTLSIHHGALPSWPDRARPAMAGANQLVDIPCACLRARRDKIRSVPSHMG